MTRLSSPRRIGEHAAPPAVLASRVDHPVDVVRPAGGRIELGNLADDRDGEPEHERERQRANRTSSSARSRRFRIRRRLGACSRRRAATAKCRWKRCRRAVRRCSVRESSRVERRRRRSSTGGSATSSQRTPRAGRRRSARSSPGRSRGSRRARRASRGARAATSSSVRSCEDDVGGHPSARARRRQAQSRAQPVDRRLAVPGRGVASDPDRRRPRRPRPRIGLEDAEAVVGDGRDEGTGGLERLIQRATSASLAAARRSEGRAAARRRRGADGTPEHRDEALPAERPREPGDGGDDRPADVGGQGRRGRPAGARSRPGAHTSHAPQASVEPFAEVLGHLPMPASVVAPRTR